MSVDLFGRIVQSCTYVCFVLADLIIQNGRVAGHCSTRFDTMMAVARAPVGVATAVTTVSGSSSMRRRAGFGHIRVRCEMERSVYWTQKCLY